MYCSKCGEMIEGASKKCPSCGAEVASGGGDAKKFLSYDYMSVDATSKTAARIIDYYEALGWEIVNMQESVLGGVSLNFKRDRKVKNKDSLVKLQTKLDDTVKGIRVLEKKKTAAGRISSLVIGIIGALILGVGMCLCMLITDNVVMFVAGIIIGVVGIVICSLNYFVYRGIVNSRTASIEPIIAKKREEIAYICEEAQKYTS